MAPPVIETAAELRDRFRQLKDAMLELHELYLEQEELATSRERNSPAVRLRIREICRRRDKIHEECGINKQLLAALKLHNARLTPPSTDVA